jgi:Domain of unknown function (DUF4169)
MFCSLLPCRFGMMGMGDLVNLKRFRKRVEREQSAKQADVNRTRFGRTKSERALDDKRTSRANDLLDQHRIDGEEAS